MTKNTIQDFCINPELKSFIAEIYNLCEPQDIVFCDGSDKEYSNLCNLLVENGTFIRLDKEKWLAESWHEQHRNKKDL